ncbi:MAG: formylglycine-generating enzyme family protein, partial [Verrucomicrobia bacterium]|nr:formylglycine-generating enzyme family protein [Verrucomicrobiota bacterium]
MHNLKLTSGLLGLALAGMTVHAAAPSLSYEVSGNDLIITYTGTLLRSSDAVNWTEVASASSPYKVALSDKKLFFCTKGATSKDITIPLSDMVDLDLIWIEPGTFLMGSPEDELGRLNNETQHKVTLTQGYWLGKYEITQAQYEAVTGTNPSSFKGGDLPVDSVSWNDAKEFCAKLNAQEKAAGRLPEGYKYTLPTEAQWEYACRAGTTTAFNNGTNIPTIEQAEDEFCPNLDEVGWYIFNSEKSTHPAGQKMPNAWGLYDMHGNVFEWCLDRFGDYPIKAVTDPTGPGTGSERIARGGGYPFLAWGCRSAFRAYSYPDTSGNFLGFRVALTSTKDITIPLSWNVNLDLIWIEPGTFTMGSPEGEMDRFDDEVQHEVTLT